MNCPTAALGFDLQAIQQDLFAHMGSIAVQPAVGAVVLLDQADFQVMRIGAALEIGDNAGHCQRLARFNEIDQLAVAAGMEGDQGSQVINRLQQAGFPLGVVAHQQHRSLRHIHIQAREIAEVGQGEVGEAHGEAVIS